MGRGGVVHSVAYGPNDMVDLAALSAKAHETEAKLVYIANPDNPSGTVHDQQHLEAFIEAASACGLSCTTLHREEGMVDDPLEARAYAYQVSILEVRIAA